MLIETKKTKCRKLSFELLGIAIVCLFLAAFLCFFLIVCGNWIVDNYCYSKNIVLSDEQVTSLNDWVVSLSVVVSAFFFLILFLVIMGDRLAYIREITKGVNILKTADLEYTLPLEGNNELTYLAETINYMSAAQKEIKEKERKLFEEREELIRTLSHDIRTPLTSIMSYSELLNGTDISNEQRLYYSTLIHQKSCQIKELLELLLEGGKREIQYFEKAQVLIKQLVCEFEEDLEAKFTISTDMSGCREFSGNFDVQELRRIFDNLSSNILKYADEGKNVELKITLENSVLVISQSNAVKRNSNNQDGFSLGIKSIQRIAHNYNGSVKLNKDDNNFEINITLSYM